MSRYAAFRRQPTEQQYANTLKTTVIPAPTRGIIQSENEAFLQPGGATVQDNWVSTLRGVKLRGGCVRWCDLHALDLIGAPAWMPAHSYAQGDAAADTVEGTYWVCTVAHISPAIGPFSADRAANPRWVQNATAATRLPVISAFEYVSSDEQKMFAANATKLFDVTGGTPILVKSGQTSGNYVAAQFANAAGEWMLVCNEAGDDVLRTKNGTTFEALDGVTVPADGAGTITGPAGALPPQLSYVWKYRNRLFFIELDSMNAWYLDIDSVGGALAQIPLAGSASKGGTLVWGGVWSLDAGDGTDDKCVFYTSLGEALIFTGTNPADPANWRQEGRYTISPPLGMNAHIQVGGDIFILTVEGIVPISQAIGKDPAQIDLALLTRNIKPLWRQEVAAKRSQAWTAKQWPEYGGMFVATPGGIPGQRGCLVANNNTGAWCRFRDGNYDPMCFIRMGPDLFFGTQSGIIMQAERGGLDDGIPYTATLVGGWEMFGAPANQIVWLQARASFHANFGQTFKPQLSACVDYQVTLPPPPPAGPAPATFDVWDQGLWDTARWDQLPPPPPPVRNTLWVSIGRTGHAHAPITQVTVAQVALPAVEMIATGATYVPGGVNV